MKLLNCVNEVEALKGKPYTAQEIDNHEDSKRIWATISKCKQEANELGREMWSKGNWDRERSLKFGPEY